MIVKVRNLKVALISLICIYFLVPTQTADVTTALAIRFFFASIFMVLMLLYGVRLPKSNGVFFLFVYIAMLSVAIFSYSLKLYLMTLSLLLAFLLSASVETRSGISEYFKSALKFIIYFSMAMLLVQIFLYRLGWHIEIHNLLFPWSSARFDTFDSIVRLGGLYIEPGTCANWLYAFFLLYVFIVREVPVKLAIVTIFTMMMTFSAWGIAIASLMFLIIILSPGGVFAKGGSRYRGLIFKASLGLLAIAFVLIFFDQKILEFLRLKLSMQTGSGQVRMAAYDQFGGSWARILFLGQGFDPAFCDGCESFQDAGVIISFSVVFGIFPAIFFFSTIFLYAFRVGGWALLFLSAPLISTKIFYWDFVLLMIFAVSLSGLINMKRRDLINGQL